ncbi:hypothetical protein F0P96_09020 [Hymenobacter busanensis]|uniref:Uncharacterized protein n=1 Tax=Hymenobacter busanensis TaxID=2607656 RepID=A0A7L5A1A7_9BACT|nr:hypothetical protein [Hymenobacter busanensis]KAA9333113.1 hypothetical protein F0P96_09020 [Hymenobacter busanensis]QHJ08212.1 hypothetical protein GUY19_13305 [Hymenobacter busanensis]
MKTLCFSLMLAVLAAAPFEASYAAPSTAAATPEAVTPSADHVLGSVFKFKRKKRKTNRRMAARRRHRMRGGY